MVTRTSPVPFRSAAAVVLSAVVVAAASTPSTARAEDPVPSVDGAAASAGAAAAGTEDTAPVAPETEAPPATAEVSVSAVVETPQGPEVVSVEVPASDVAEAAAELRTEPGAVAVAVDSPVSVLDWEDPWSHEQWGLSELNLAEPLPEGIPDGSGVQVAVIDTGVEATHEDLAGRVRCDLGADFTAGPESSSGDGCTDPHGHGTHVAGTVGAIAGNGIGVTGLSAAEIIPVRVLGETGWGEDAGVVAGIYWAVDHGAEVVNLSLGGNEPNPLFDEAVHYAISRGVVVVAAAGNNREDGNLVHYPAATPGVFAVASTDWRGVSSWFSYSGPTNLIAAPGSDIVSTTTGEQSYGSKSGTSMATPHVAGVLARYRDAHPAVTVAEIRAAVQATAVDIEAPGKDANTGYGLIDAYQLLTGQESPARSWVTAPGEPTQLRITPRHGSLDLTWQPPLFTGGVPVEGYVVTVHQGTEVSETSFLRNVAAGPAARRLTVPGLTNGTPYLLFLTAYHSAGELWGNSAFTPTPVHPVQAVVPGAARIGTASPAAAAATVRWAAPASDGGAAVSRYTVRAYRGATLVKTVTATGTARSAAVTGLANGAAHTFTVTASNVAGSGPASARSAAVTPRTTPGAPRIGTPSPGDGSARVRWAAPTSNGGAAISAYLVRAYRGSTLVRSVTVSGTATSASVTGLRNGSGHTFTVTAKNAAGYGPASARSRTVVPRR